MTNLPPANNIPVRKSAQTLEEELSGLTAKIKRDANGPLPAQLAQHSVAEDLAKFIEQHADEAVKEAETHREEAYAYAKELRERTAEQIARLRAFTDSIKASQQEMAEVRTRFLKAGTTNPQEQ